VFSQEAYNKLKACFNRIAIATDMKISYKTQNPLLLCFTSPAMFGYADVDDTDVNACVVSI
jgi:hypothetical protein